MTFLPAQDDPDVLVFDDTPVIPDPVPDPTPGSGWVGTTPFAVFETDQAQVSTLTGYGPAGGALFSAPVAVPGWIEDTVTVVRGDDGSELTSTRTWHAPLTAHEALTPGSRLTYGGLTSTILSVSVAAYGWPTDGVTARVA